MSHNRIAGLADRIGNFLESEEVRRNGWTPAQMAELVATTLLAPPEPLATLCFRAEADDSAASFLNLLTPARPGEGGIEKRRVVANGERGYGVHVVTRDGEEFDAEVRDVIVGDDDARYKLVVWPWGEGARGGDRTRQMVFDIYDGLERIEVI